MIESHAFTGTVFCAETLLLGEGPSYDPATDTVWWFNIKGQALHEYQLSTATKRVHPLPFLGSVIASINPERQLIVSDQGLFLRDIASGRLDAFAKIEDRPGNRSNDGRIHPSGALWIGTMGRNAEPQAGSIYHVAGDRVTKLFGEITVPNGICFSPDGTIGYFADSEENYLMRVELDPATGLPTGQPSVLSDERSNPGCLDGSVCDADGLIWNARWGGSAVEVYRPDGTKIARYATPAVQTSCPAFFGPKADRLLATSAWQGYDDAARAADPQAGQTFDLGISVRGRFEPAFRL